MTGQQLLRKWVRRRRRPVSNDVECLQNIKCRKTLQTLRFFLKWQKFVAFPLYYPSAAPWQFWKTASFNPPSPVRKSWQVFRTFKEFGSTSIYKNFFFLQSAKYFKTQKQRRGTLTNIYKKTTFMLWNIISHILFAVLLINPALAPTLT